MATTPLGKTTDGRALSYDAALYEFVLDGSVAPYADVKMLDSRGWVRWRADVLREWFRRIVPADLQRCHERAQAGLTAGAQAGAGDAADVAVQAAAEQGGPSAGQGPVAQARPAARSALAQSAKSSAAVAPVSPQASSGAASSAMKSFKSKDGKLAKDKSFSLSSSLAGEVVFQKVEGDAGITVKPRGKVVAEKGLATGTYAIEVQAVSMSDAATETIQVTVRVK